jgi:hypothetical protein
LTAYPCSSHRTSTRPGLGARLRARGTCAREQRCCNRRADRARSTACLAQRRAWHQRLIPRFALTTDSEESMVKRRKSQIRKLNTALRWKIPAAQGLSNTPWLREAGGQYQSRRIRSELPRPVTDDAGSARVYAGKYQPGATAKALSILMRVVSRWTRSSGNQPVTFARPDVSPCRQTPGDD